MEGPHFVHKPSVTRWINDLRGGDDSAADLLWGFLKSRLMSLASTKTGSTAVYDEEDVAISAFATLCSGIQVGRYDQIDNRENLWSLLAVITINRARKLARNEGRIRRGGNVKQVNDSDHILSQYFSKEPSPEFSTLAKEECRRLLDLLPKQELRVVAILKVDGHTNEEVAEILGCSRRSIQRRLNLIRDIWVNELP
jgi:RNA polymerase sigma factor (sigma-70 family)